MATNMVAFFNKRFRSKVWAAALQPRFGLAEVDPADADQIAEIEIKMAIACYADDGDGDDIHRVQAEALEVLDAVQAANSEVSQVSNEEPLMRAGPLETAEAIAWNVDALLLDPGNRKRFEIETRKSITACSAAKPDNPGLTQGRQFLDYPIPPKVDDFLQNDIHNSSSPNTSLEDAFAMLAALHAVCCMESPNRPVDPCPEGDPGTPVGKTTVERVAWAAMKRQARQQLGEQTHLLNACLQRVRHELQQPEPLRQAEQGTEPIKSTSARSGSVRKNGVHKEIDKRMRKAALKNPECVEWTIRKWAEVLDCSVASINAASFWKECESARQRAKLSRRSRTNDG